LIALIASALRDGSGRGFGQPSSVEVDAPFDFFCWRSAFYEIAGTNLKRRIGRIGCGLCSLVVRCAFSRAQDAAP
jgi:hypothetical protein